MQLPYLVENDLRLKTLGVYRCVIRTILDRSACPLRPRCKKSTGTCGLEKLTSWCWHNNDSTMTIMPNSTTLNSSPTKPLSGPACQVGSRDGASSQRHEQGGWPSIEHNVETMLYSCKSVVPSPAPFQAVDMIMVLLKTTTSAPSSSLSFSPHSFLTTPHTPDPLMDTASCQNSLLSTPSQHYPLLFLTLSRPQLPVCPSLYTSSFLPVLSLPISRPLQFIYICSLAVTGWVHVPYRASNYGLCVRAPTTIPGLSTHPNWHAHPSCLIQPDQQTYIFPLALFLLSTLNYDARSTTHQLYRLVLASLTFWRRNYFF